MVMMVMTLGGDDDDGDDDGDDDRHDDGVFRCLNYAHVTLHVYSALAPQIIFEFSLFVHRRRSTCPTDKFFVTQFL